MTREEKVKDLLTELIDMIDNGSQRDLDKADEICTSIIKLFEQDQSETIRGCTYGGVSWGGTYKPQEPSEDVISRAAAEALFRNARSKLNPADYKTADEFNTRDLMLLNAEQFIHLLPSVKLKESKTGHWIGHREHCENLGVMPSGLGAYEWCSNCDCGIDAVEWHRNTYNYCPNCGIKMVEPQESEGAE